MHADAADEGTPVTSLIDQHAEPAARSRAVRLAGAAPDDIAELIMADHRRLDRLRQTVDGLARYGDGPDWSAAAWQRLADLLDAHIRAEEEICYLSGFGSGPQGFERMRHARACNDGIREAIGQARRQSVGSAPWWRAVRAVLAAVAEHIDSEQSRAIAGWMLSLTASRRRELGRTWTGFISA
jgi:hypothetical protein